MRWHRSIRFSSVQNILHLFVSSQFSLILKKTFHSNYKPYLTETMTQRIQTKHNTIFLTLWSTNCNQGTKTDQTIQYLTIYSLYKITRVNRVNENGKKETSRNALVMESEPNSNIPSTAKDTCRIIFRITRKKNRARIITRLKKKKEIFSPKLKKSEKETHESRRHGGGQNPARSLFSSLREFLKHAS